MSSKEFEMFKFSERLAAFPVVHGSGDYAQEVRRLMLSRSFDCLAVPLPNSFRDRVLQGVDLLPRVSVVGQEGETEDSASYVPIDPCQPVIAGLRVALHEHMNCAFVDLETADYQPYRELSPDPYALKQMAPSRFAAAMLPFLQPPEKDSQRQARVRRMAFELHRLELDYESILFLPAIQDWPWIRDAYRDRADYQAHERSWKSPKLYDVDADSLYFVLGEIPFVTYLYEKRRRQLQSDEHLSVDGVKELLIEARNRWQLEYPEQKRWVTPQLLKLCLQYIRNLTLFDGRLTPDLYSMTLAAKQVGGDSFAIHLVETAKTYPYQDRPNSEGESSTSSGPARPGQRSTKPFQNPGFLTASIGGEMGRLGDGGEVHVVSRLPGPPQIWRYLQLKPKPKRHQRKRWKQRWNPYQQCSWTPEDERIESFNAHVRDQARALLAEDLGHSSKFTCSLKDGLDMRETLRNWHTGDLYVREVPSSRGSMEIVVFLFEDPLDEQKFAWRSTWYAEHEEESTLCFCATPYRNQLVGPGVALSRYGGLMLLYPPRWIPDIWEDPRLESIRGSLDRLVAAAILHSQERHVVIVGPRPPLSKWKKLARKHKKNLVYIPISRFSGQLIENLRHFHVLNGRDVRSYAAQYIRDF